LKKALVGAIVLALVTSIAYAQTPPATVCSGVTDPAACPKATATPTPAPVVTPTPVSPCSYHLSAWMPSEHSSQTDTWLSPAARGEGICNLAYSVRAWGRADAYQKLPNAAQPPNKPSDVGAYEVWGGFSRIISSPLSAAAFSGIHGAIGSGALAGGVSSSFCLGGRLDYGADYSVVGLCNAYKPLGSGVAVAGTLVFPVKGVVGVAANFAYLPRSGRYLFAVGPTASWSNTPSSASK
jgi:hypothetical protein